MIGKGAYSEPLILKIGPLHIFFIILMNPAKEYLYTREIRKKFKVGIFFIHEKVGKCDFDRRKERIQTHLS